MLRKSKRGESEHSPVQNKPNNTANLGTARAFQPLPSSPWRPGRAGPGRAGPGEERRETEVKTRAGGRSCRLADAPRCPRLSALYRTAGWVPGRQKANRKKNPKKPRGRIKQKVSRLGAVCKTPRCLFYFYLTSVSGARGLSWWRSALLGCRGAAGERPGPGQRLGEPGLRDTCGAARPQPSAALRVGLLGHGAPVCAPLPGLCGTLERLELWERLEPRSSAPAGGWSAACGGRGAPRPGEVSEGECWVYGDLCRGCPHRFLWHGRPGAGRPRWCCPVPRPAAVRAGVPAGDLKFPLPDAGPPSVWSSERKLRNLTLSWFVCTMLPTWSEVGGLPCFSLAVALARFKKLVK